ncbi:MAG TPA: DUF2203 domain-containing protein, partial [Candidatus Baltobacteraceae bacterium]
MKLFSPEKANALIPKVMPLLEELWTKRRDLAIKLLESDPGVGGVTSIPHPRVAGLRSPFAPGRFSERKAEIVRLINRIEAYGCIVKDIDLGLVDFPSMREGRPVYLCWKPGEPQIAHWHEIAESFTDRR